MLEVLKELPWVVVGYLYTERGCGERPENSRGTGRDWWGCGVRKRKAAASRGMRHEWCALRGRVEAAGRRIEDYGEG